jgi:hypothetical protein
MLTLSALGQRLKNAERVQLLDSRVLQNNARTSPVDLRR